MNKKLVALLAVATMGISVVGATPQTQFTKVKLKLILALQALKLKQTVFKAAHKWNFDGNITHALRDKTAINTVTMVLNSKHVDSNMQEVNLIQTLSKNFALYGGCGRIH